MRIRLLILSVTALLGRSAEALDATPPPGWHEAKRNAELIVFYKENEQAKARDILAYTELNAPPEAVFRVVTDFDHSAEFMPYIKESRILARPAPDEEITYQIMSAPLISDRDYYLHVKLTQGSPATGGAFKSEWTSIPDYLPERKGMVRIRLNQGSWTYEPIDGGRRTRLVYSLLTNPAGAIPAWIVNMSNLGVIENMIKAVRTRLGK